MERKLVLIVIDGLRADALESALGDSRLPALSFLAENGSYGRAASTFPSLTPVCLSALATGAHPDVHEIPHLVWYHAREGRVVEYGSSFGALRAAGFARSLRDAIVDMNARHLGAGAVTVFEALEDAGVVPACVNFTCYRGRTLHRSTMPGVPPVRGPKRFFFYNLFESSVTGAPLVRGRAGGSVDAYASAVGRWLVTRDGFDFLVYYLSDYDFSSHLAGPDGSFDALARADARVGALLEAAGGPDAFLERYAVVVCSDHGQTHVERAAPLQAAFADVDGVVVTASNRAGMVYALPGCPEDPPTLARRLDRFAAADVVLFREGDAAVARRDGVELRFAPAGDGWRLDGDAAVLDFPDALARAWGAIANPNAGELVVSAAPGWEFSDLAGGHHAGGGSHGSLDAGDSEVPMLTIGIGAQPRSIVEVAPAVLAHFGVEPPAYTRALARAA